MALRDVGEEKWGRTRVAEAKRGGRWEVMKKERRRRRSTLMSERLGW